MSSSTTDRIMKPYTKRSPAIGWSESFTHSMNGDSASSEPSNSVFSIVQ